MHKVIYTFVDFDKKSILYLGTVIFKTNPSDKQIIDFMFENCPQYKPYSYGFTRLD